MAKIKFTEEEFNQVKEKGESFYNSVGKVHCPYFGEHIKFNRKGLDHIRFQRWNHSRVQICPINESFAPRLTEKLDSIRIGFSVTCSDNLTSL